MSRCFPFPPPEYERKHKPEDLALLKEVKQKDKKRKQEKKKERSKDKEKDGSEKHRDKKDRKGKHKDKKEKPRDKQKDKEDRGKDKEKSSISEESTVAGNPEERTREKLHHKRDNKCSSVDDEGKSSFFFHGRNAGKPCQSILPSEASKEARFVQALDRWIRDDEKSRRSQFPQRVESTENGDQVAPPGIAAGKPSSILAEEKSNDGDKRVRINKLETQGLDGEFSEKALVPNFTRVVKSKNEVIPIPVEEKNDWRFEEKEKYKETGDDKRREKPKERDKKSYGEDRVKEKEKKKELEAKAKVERKKGEHEISKSTGKDYLGSATKTTNLLKDVDLTALNGGKIRKHADVRTNGFLHDSESMPNKVQRLALHQSTENGRTFEASQTSVPKMKDHIAEEAPMRYPHPDSKYLSQILTVPEVGQWSGNDDQEWLFTKKDPPNKPELESAGVKEELLVWSEAVHIESADVYALPYVIPY